MFQDCFRCGYGWHHKETKLISCPCCAKMDDEWAKYVKEHRIIRYVDEIKDWECPQCHKIMDAKIGIDSLGNKSIGSHFH